VRPDERTNVCFVEDSNVKRSFLQHAALLALIGLAACSAGSQSQVPSAGSGAGAMRGGNRQTQQLRAFSANCSITVPIVNIALCTNIELGGGPVLGAGTPADQVPGLHPADLQAAYALPSASAGQGQAIGVVIADADPNAEADLAVYRSTFGLPACTKQNGCLQIVSSSGSGDKGWAREASTDLQMASAVCPNCRLVLAQAASTKAGDLAAAVTAAISAGATVVSNSYVIPEDGSEAAIAWSHANVPVIAAAGDLGYGAANWPAAATNVIAVGATTLVADSGSPRGWTESAWSGTGSACSFVAAKPAWQHDAACRKRTVADVAAVGDPATPVAVYDSYQDTGWIQVGGTSVATPIVAGVYGLAANGAQFTGAASLYANPGALNPVTSGANGLCLLAPYLCNAGPGYNGPAGMGSPNGIAAF
jgi:subtilase family serine protease